MAEEVNSLMKATVLMRQPGRVQEIVGALRRGGGDRLQVISDFDMTLSRFAYNGQRCPSSHNILDNSKIISEDCRKEEDAATEDVSSRIFIVTLFYMLMEKDPKPRMHTA